MIPLKGLRPRPAPALAALLALAVSALAVPALGAEGLTLSFLGDGPLGTKARERVMIALSAANPGKGEKDLSLEAALPEGWTLIGALPSFDLDSGASELLLVPVFVPLHSPGGEYRLEFRVVSKGGLPLAYATVQVNVLSASALRASILSRPLNCKAGGSYTLVYSLANEGNAPVSVRISGRSELGVPFAFIPPGSEERELGPGEAFTVAAAVSPPADIYERYYHRFVLEIAAIGAVTGEAAENISLRSTTEVIPILSGRTTETHVLPGTASLRGYGASGDDPNLGGSLSLDLNGSLDVKREHKIEVHAEKTLDTVNSLLDNPQDRYYATYAWRFLKTGVGDLDFMATELSDGKRGGFGAYAEAAFDAAAAGAFGAGGYLFGNRRAADLPMSAAFFTDYLPPGRMKDLDYRIRAALASDLGQDLTLGLRQSIRPLKTMDASLEVAAGNLLAGRFDPALLLESKGDFSAWYYQGRINAAAPDFSGPQANILDVQLLGGARLLDQRLLLSASVRETDRNLGNLPAPGTDENGVDALLDATYDFPRGGTALSAGTGLRSRIDRFEPAEFDELSGRLRLGARQAMGKGTSLNGYGELWLGREGVLAQSFLDQRYALDFSTRPAEDFSANASVNAQIRNYLENPPAAGDSMNLSWSAGTSWSLTRLDAGIGLRNAYQLDGGTLTGYSFDAVATGKWIFPWGHWLDISFGGGFGNTDGANALTFDLKYTAPFGIKLNERVETGLLKVSVVDDAANRPLPDVIVRMGNAAAMTDAAGVATFRVARPGTYFLDLDRMSLPRSYVPRARLPAEASILLQSELGVTIPVTPAALVKGRVRVLDFESALAAFTPEKRAEAAQPAGDMVERASPPTQILELKNGDDIRIASSDESGAFIFDELYSGTWTLRVLPAGIPEYHYPETPSMDIVIEPGSAKEADYRILPQKREMRMTEDLGTLDIEIAPPSPKPLPKAVPKPSPKSVPKSTPKPSPKPR